MPKKFKMRRKGWKMKLLLLAQTGCCFHCGMGVRFLSDKNDPEFATAEHLIPRSKGGDGSTVVVAHKRCNSLRGNKDPTPEEIAKMLAVRARFERIATERGVRETEIEQPFSSTRPVR